MHPNNSPNDKRAKPDNAAAALGFSAFAILLCTTLLSRYGYLNFSDNALGIIAVQICAFILPPIVFVVFSKRKTRLFETIRLRKRKTFRFTLASMFLLLSSVILIKGFFALVFQNDDAAVSSISEGTSFGIVILVNVLLAAFLEELFFRGILFSAFEYSCGGLGAIVGCAFYFAAIHFSGTEFAAYFVAGIILGTVTYVTRSVFAAVVLHLVNNLVSLFFESAVFKMASENKSGILAVVILVSITLVLLIWQLRELEIILRQRALRAAEKEESVFDTAFPRLVPDDISTGVCLGKIFLSPWLLGLVVILTAYLTI